MNNISRYIAFLLITTVASLHVLSYGISLNHLSTASTTLGNYNLANAPTKTDHKRKACILKRVSKNWNFHLCLSVITDKSLTITSQQHQKTFQLA